MERKKRIQFMYVTDKNHVFIARKGDSYECHSSLTRGPYFKLWPLKEREVNRSREQEV
jgi:hypothetical protein